VNTRLLVAFCAASLVGGESCTGPTLTPGWQTVARDVPGALLSVAEKDGTVVIVGGDPDEASRATMLLSVHDGPAVGAPLVAVDTGLEGDLWWVHPVSSTRVYVSGSFGRVARVDIADGDVARAHDALRRGEAPPVVITELDTPDDARTVDVVVFGVFVSDDEREAYAVGGLIGGVRGGFCWRSVDGGPFEPLTVPSIDDVDVSGGGYALWKVDAVSGPAPLAQVWIVGTEGLAYRADGGALVAAPTGLRTSLFTVDVGPDGNVLAVGGVGRGLVVARAGDASAFVDVSPAGDATPALLGVQRAADGTGLAVGPAGVIFDVTGSTLSETGALQGITEGLHAGAALDDGSRYAVGGLLSGLPLRGGVALRFVP